MIRLTVLFLFVFLLSADCLAQRRVLMLQKRSRNKNVYYEPGDRLSFTLKGSHEKVTGEIVGFKDDVIVFNGFEIPVREIGSLYIDGKTRWWLRFKVAQIGLMGGGAYMLLELLNTGTVSKETLIIGGSFVAVGLLAKVLIGNQIKIKGRTRLRILKL